MARDRANIRTEMWADRDIRSLSIGAQHLYLLLLTHSSLSYAGVADWRPARLAAMTRGWDRKGVESSAQELSRTAFIHTDDDTEEVVVRSFLRHDGVIKHPRLHVSMANDWATIASVQIQEFVAFELQKLHSELPGLALWNDERVKTILRFAGKDLKTFSQEVWQDETKSSPTDLLESLPKESQSTSMRTATTTATTTTTSNEVVKREAPQKRGTRIPHDFHVTPEMAQWAATNAPNSDINRETMKFKNHWESQSRNATKLDWVKTWRNWLLRDYSGATSSKPTASDKIRNTLAKGQALQAQFNQTSQPELGA